MESTRAQTAEAILDRKYQQVKKTCGGFMGKAFDEYSKDNLIKIIHILHEDNTSLDKSFNTYTPEYDKMCEAAHKDFKSTGKRVMDEFGLTKEEIYYLADVAWFLKGYAQGKGEDDPNDLGMKHFEVVTKVIRNSKN